MNPDQLITCFFFAITITWMACGISSKNEDLTVPAVGCFILGLFFIFGYQTGQEAHRYTIETYFNISPK